MSDCFQFKIQINIDKYRMAKTEEKGIYWIKYMYEEISDKINTLMHQLQQTYKQYNIECKTHEHFSIVLRILTPIEILDKFSSPKNKYLSFDSPEILKNFLKAIDNQINNQIVIDNSSESQINRTSKLYKQKRGKNSAKQLVKRQIERKYDDLSSSLSSYINNSQGQQAQLLKREGKKNRGRKPMLNDEQERKLVKWMEQQCRVHRRLVKQQIINTALQITKNESFHPNDLWLRRLINKYPVFKQFLLKKVKYVRKQNQMMMNWNDMRNKRMYPYQKQKLKGKNSNMDFIDLNQSESFEQIREERQNNEQDFSSEQEKEVESIKENKKLRQDGEIQLSEAVQSFQYALKRNRSQFYQKNPKSKKK